jgi:RNA polymerase sigma-70 factor (ECF subfamily)
MDDIELVKAICNNDNNAFRKLFDLFYKRLLAYANTFTYDSKWSEDIVQQAFVTLWLKKDQLDKDKSPINYLYSIVHNSYIDDYRKKRRRDVFLDNLKHTSLIDNIDFDHELLEKRLFKLNRIIESLPPKCKEILKLNKIEGIKYKSIAVKMNISIKTVESQMRIAFQKIREGFEEGDSFFLFLVTKFNFINKH